MRLARIILAVNLSCFIAGAAFACYKLTMVSCGTPPYTPCEDRCKLPDTCLTGEVWPTNTGGKFWAVPGTPGKTSYAPYEFWCKPYYYCSTDYQACGSPGSGMVSCTPDTNYWWQTFSEMGMQLSGDNC